jgi:hypothetical protein
MDALPTLEFLADAATAITMALTHVGAAQRDEAWQDGLDLLAVLAGVKPLCIVGRGARGLAWSETLRGIATRANLPVAEFAPWDAAADLPGWYLAASARRRESLSVLAICADAAMRDAAVALAAKGRVGPEEEAALLGYPRCCVAAHHQRMQAIEQLTAELTERVARGDAARMLRMIETGAAPLPQSPADWARFSAAARPAPLPFTSIVPCAACAADTDGPAQRIARRHAALAHKAGYGPL